MQRYDQILQPFIRFIKNEKRVKFILMIFIRLFPTEWPSRKPVRTSEEFL